MNRIAIAPFVYISFLLIILCHNQAIADNRPKLVMIIAEDEYETKTLLPGFAEKYLSDYFRVIDLHGSADRPDLIVGLEDHINDAEILLISIRRRPLNEYQTGLIRDFITSGKPIVAIRTSSHAFTTRSGDGPGIEWPEFDPEVLGGNYTGHHGNRGRFEADPEKTTYIWPVYEKLSHPILRGINPDKAIAAWSWLYKVRPLGDDTEVLMKGRVGNELPTEPVAWTNIHAGGGKVFYTSKGHPEEFEEEWFQRLLRNGIFWAADMEIPEGL